MKFSANLSMLFTEYSFMERFQAARKSGFRGVEYLFPYDYSADEIASELYENGLSQVLFNLPAGSWDKGERGIACLPDRINEFRIGVDKAIEYAKKLNCKRINCLAGKKPPCLSDEDANKTLINNLRYAAEMLSMHGITLLIEAINTRDIPGYFLNTTSKVIEVINAVKHENIKYQYDIYHMQIMEGDISRTIYNNLNIIDHIQLADNPGRHEPGTGEINYDFILRYIRDAGYQGWIGCEYSPLSSTEDGLHWIEQYI